MLKLYIHMLLVTSSYFLVTGGVVTVMFSYLCHGSVDPTVRNCGSFQHACHSFMCVRAAASNRELMLAASLC